MDAEDAAELEAIKQTITTAFNSAFIEHYDLGTPQAPGTAQRHLNKIKAPNWCAKLLTNSVSFTVVKPATSINIEHRPTL